MTFDKALVETYLEKPDVSHEKLLTESGKPLLGASITAGVSGNWLAARYFAWRRVHAVQVLTVEHSIMHAF